MVLTLWQLSGLDLILEIFVVFLTVSLRHALRLKALSHLCIWAWFCLAFVHCVLCSGDLHDEICTITLAKTPYLDKSGIWSFIAAEPHAQPDFKHYIFRRDRIDFKILKPTFDMLAIQKIVWENDPFDDTTHALQKTCRATLCNYSELCKNQNVIKMHFVINYVLSKLQFGGESLHFVIG